MDEADRSMHGARGTEGDPRLGQVLGGRYRLDATLGGGGMGAMYRAQDLVLDRAVALKLLDPALVAEPEVAQRFDREALALSKLDHPNVVQVYDAGTTPEGAKYIVMALVEGGELRRLLALGPMPPARAVGLALQILRGLDHAHRRGLVHRDLKPENVLVARDDDGHERLELVDFGIVKVLASGSAKLTRAGQVFGTPRYMSPEQVSGGTVDARADLYALGVVLYEMLAGRAPFEADQAGMLLRMHVIAEPPPLPDTVPLGLRQVLARLLAKRPADRPGSAREVIEVLERIDLAMPVVVAAQPAVAWIVPPREPPRALERELDLGRERPHAPAPNLVLRALAMVLLVVLVAIAALSFNSWRQG